MNKLLLASLLVLTVSTVYACVKTAEGKEVPLEVLHRLVKENLEKIGVDDFVQGRIARVFSDAVELKLTYEQLCVAIDKLYESLEEKDAKLIKDFYEKNHREIIANATWPGRDD